MPRTFIVQNYAGIFADFLEKNLAHFPPRSGFKFRCLSLHHYLGGLGPKAGKVGGNLEKGGAEEGRKEKLVFSYISYFLLEVSICVAPYLLMYIRMPPLHKCTRLRAR